MFPGFSKSDRIKFHCYLLLNAKNHDLYLCKLRNLFVKLEELSKLTRFIIVTAIESYTKIFVRELLNFDVVALEIPYVLMNYTL